jgi:K+-transporting ATPase c subunit
MKYYKPRTLVVVSLLVTFICGCIYPSFGYLYAKALFALMNKTSLTFWKDINFWMAMFFVVAFGGGIASFF